MEIIAKELEKFNGNYFETSNDIDGVIDVMHKGIDGRKNVVYILKLQGGLRLRMNYLNGANIFARNVHDMEDAYPELN